MAWGNDNEFRAVGEVEAHTGLIFEGTGDNQTSDKRDWLSATPDGWCEYNSTRIGLEVKCPEKPCEEIRPHYMAQIQGQCYVCDFAEVMFANWTHQTFCLWRVYRSEEYIAEMLLLLEGFRAYLETDEPPPRLNRRPKLPEVEVERIL